MEPETKPPSVEPEVSKRKTILPFILIGGGIIFLVLLAIVGIIVGLSFLKAAPNTPLLITQTPTPVPTIIEVISNPNPKFASDSGFLKMRDDLKSLNAEIGSANFFEPEISPPNIDLNLKIE